MSLKTIGLGALALLWLAPAPGSGQTSLEYAVKYVCGHRMLLDPRNPLDTLATVIPGWYGTVVNVHNPSPDSVRLSVHVVPDGANPLATSTLWLLRDRALELDCAYIYKAFERSPRYMFKGFVIIRDTADVDVTAVYTAGAATGVQTMDVERITPRRALIRR